MHPEIQNFNGRVGTLKCFLFGHCFIATHTKVMTEQPFFVRKWGVPVDYCVRCGLSKNPNKYGDQD